MMIVFAQISGLNLNFDKPAQNSNCISNGNANDVLHFTSTFLSLSTASDELEVLLQRSTTFTVDIK